MKYQLGVNSVVRKKTTPKINLGDIPRNRESSLYSGDEKNYLGTGENYKTLGGSFDTKKGYFGAETWINKANMSPSLYGTYSKEIKPNLNLDASVGINDRYIGLGLTKSFSKGGVNLVAGGEKHRVYVKKSPTGVGKGVKGHVMVNHPTSDKGKWDTIDLTEKAGAKTVEQGKAATRKWHRENPYKMQDGSKKIKTLKKKHLGDIYEKEKDNEGNDLQGFDYWKEKFMKDNNLSEEDAIALIDEIKSEQRLRGVSDKIYKYKNPFVESSEIIPETYTLPYNKYVDMKTLKANKPNRNMVIGEDVFLSGAKSVKQYRGDENLPEAKKGMKNCGCKHSRSKYKYQNGEKKIKSSSNDEENKIARERYNYLKALEERSRKQDSTYYANNIGRMIDQAVENNTRVYVTENREGKPLKGKKSGDNTCITGVCNVAKKAGAKIPFNSVLAEDRNSVGDNPIETRYNPAFRDNAKKMGFQLLPQSAKLQRGDIVQLNETGTPHHAMLYYGENNGGSIFGNDVGNEDDGRSFFGLGPKKDLGFEKRWMGPFSNRTSGGINPIAKNALAYRYMGVPSKRASMEEALAYAKAKAKKTSKKENPIVKIKPNKTEKINNNLIPDPSELELDQIVSYDNIDKSELTLEKNGNKNIRSNIMNRYKYKYKYGTGALTIPEGSAIVTANGGKNMQALRAYKKGNYKLLNKIIDGMPEDNVDKAQAGRQSLEARYKQLGELTGPLSEAQQKEFEDIKSQLTQDEYDLYTDERIAEKFGQKYDVDRPEYRSSVRGGKLNLIEDTENVNYRNRLRNEPAFFQQQLKEGKVTIDKDGNISYQPKGEHSKNAMEFLGTSKKGALPQLTAKLEPLQTVPPPSTKLPPEKDKDSIRKRGLNVPAMAEIAARSSILGQGIAGVPEYYLNLDRYKYASQLPKTLREIQLAEQAGKETARDIVAGDAGRYLAQTGNLSSARMKAANEAVIQDTLARQDILNKNVDLSNIELQTNRGLKDQYAQQRAMTRAAYDQQLIGLGQRIDSATETAQEMANQRRNDEQRLQTLRDLGINYDIKDIDGLLKLVPKTAAKGLKKAKAYKRK